MNYYIWIVHADVRVRGCGLTRSRLTSLELIHSLVHSNQNVSRGVWHPHNAQEDNIHVVIHRDNTLNTLDISV